MNNKKVFISGSMSIKKLPNDVHEVLDEIISKNIEILVGDAFGVDMLIQNYCYNKSYDNVTVYHVGDKPRNLVNEDTFKTKHINTQDSDKTEKEKQIRKDIKMTDDCDYCFVIWDEKSPGSYNNILRSLPNKYTKVYLEPSKKYLSSKEDNFKDDIKVIYNNNSGYSKKEFLKFIKEDFADNCNLKNMNTFNKFLVEKNILMKLDTKYIPTDNYKKDFLEKTYKGKFIEYKFTDKIYDIISKLLTESKLPFC